MKMAMTALAVVFLASAAPALAEPGDPDRPQRDDQPSRADDHDRAHRDGEGGRQRVREAPVAPAAARAPEAPRVVPPRAVEPRAVDPRAVDPRAQAGDGGPLGRGPGDSVGRPGPWTPNAGGQTLTDRGRDARRDTPPVVGGDPRRGDGRRDHTGDNDHHGDGRRDDPRQAGDRQTWDRHDFDRRDGDRHDGDRHDGDRRDWDRRDGDRRGDDRRNEWRHDDGHRDFDRRGDHERWERGRYPSVYFSSQRYRYAWRPPVGFYARTWSFGEFLPRGWYGPEYFLGDPWTFGLPYAPPGFDWVRVGEDALLIDQYSGRIVQVVRDVFW
ncbi:RcnB family protein [Phenylobacterium sp.]|uniref:RcnB family protein n=1 Tax=Phenylobacterium sp. TaxID=1871053 RepID=UPI0025D343DE|nr:RcnB family protein [Phenylobacterium sp.]